MAITLAVMNGKGGVGKTTLALIIAGQMAFEGKRTIILDCDDRQNARRWWENCGKHNTRAPNIDVRKADNPDTIEQMLVSAKAEAPIVVADLEGRNTNLAGPVLEHANLVISPTLPTVADFAGVIQAKHFIDGFGQETGREIPLACIMNRMDIKLRHEDVYKQRRRLCENIKVHLLNNELWDRNPYRAMSNGYGTIQTLEGDTESINKAKQEAATMVGELIQLILATAPKTEPVRKSA